jgi:hypothetical protein
MAEEEAARRITTIQMYFGSSYFLGPIEHSTLVESLSAMSSACRENLLSATIPMEIKERALKVMSSDEYFLALQLLQRNKLAEFLLK